MAPPNRARSRFAALRIRRETGDTLVEVLIAIVVIGIVSSGSFFALSVGATSSKSQRDFVTADQLLRNSAEATKAAVRSACADGGTMYSIKYSTLPSPDSAQNWHQYYEVDRHFTLPADIAPRNCPTPTGSFAAPTVALSVTLPSGTTKSLSIIVRSP